MACAELGRGASRGVALVDADLVASKNPAWGQCEAQSHTAGFAIGSAQGIGDHLEQFALGFLAAGRRHDSD